jgi:hypothetical protein
MIRKGQLSEENMPAYAKIYLYFVSESELLQQWLAHNG